MGYDILAPYWFLAAIKVPAMYNIIEACQQLEASCGQDRQIPDAKRALVCNEMCKMLNNCPNPVSPPARIGS